MKITVNGKERTVPPGARMAAVVEEFEQSVRNDPMIISPKQTTGRSQLLSILNAKVVTTENYETIELRDGDDLRMVHPYFGGWAHPPAIFDRTGMRCHGVASVPTGAVERGHLLTKASKPSISSFARRAPAPAPSHCDRGAA